MNDLPVCINDIDKIVMFADDTSILFTDADGNGFASRITETLEKVNRWFAVNSLSLNVNKTHAMRFMLRPSINQHNLPFICDSESIEVVENVKFLGLSLDCKLQWHNHIKNLAG